MTSHKEGSRSRSLLRVLPFFLDGWLLLEEGGNPKDDDGTDDGCA